MFERPYFVEPAGKAEKVYALLRDAMVEADVIGIARIVMHTKEHLVALVPAGPVLTLNTMRWTSELRPASGVRVPGQGLPAVTIKPGERQMAARLIAEMTAPWKVEKHAEHFSTAIRALVRRKLAAGQGREVPPLEETPDRAAPVQCHRPHRVAGQEPSAAGRNGSAGKAGTPEARGRKRSAARRSRAG